MLKRQRTLITAPQKKKENTSMLFFFSSCILKLDNLTLLPLGGDTVEPARLPYYTFFFFVFLHK